MDIPIEHNGSGVLIPRKQFATWNVCCGSTTNKDHYLTYFKTLSTTTRISLSHLAALSSPRSACVQQVNNEEHDTGHGYKT